MPETALIVGAGSGLSAALTRLLSAEGFRVALAARNPEKLAELCRETGAQALSCDAARADQVARLFERLDAGFGTPDLVVYNASYRARGPFVSLAAEEVEKTLQVTAWGGFLVAQQAVRRMLTREAGASGSLFFTGASASVKGYAQSAPFAMGKFALRGLAQSLARELQPQNLHVAHFVIDGAIDSPRHVADPARPDSRLDPAAVAASYLAVYRQPRSAWTEEIALRPWLEPF